MANNVYSMLSAYLKYQRDLGVEDIVFDEGSAVRKILFGGGSSGTGGYLRGKPSSAQKHYGQGLTDGSGGGPGHSKISESRGGGASPLSKLSEIRTVDALDIRKFDRGDIAQALPPPGKADTPRRKKLAEFYREIGKCDKCGLSRGRTKVVFGAGSADGSLFVIGGAPSPSEDAAGLPFQGEKGELFDKILGKMGLSRKEDVFSTYLQKCIGEFYSGNLLDNSNLLDAECALACLSALDKQIDIIEPKAILIFGAPSAKILLGNNGNIEQLRAANHKYKGRPVIVTYPLSLMLEDTQYRYGAWDDMKKILNILR